MNYEKYDKIILDFNKKIKSKLNDKKRKKYKSALLSLKENILKDKNKYIESIVNENLQKKNSIKEKISNLETLIKIYTEKKNSIQYPYSLVSMNNDLNELLERNEKLLQNINSNLSDIFNKHCNRNNFDKENEILHKDFKDITRLKLSKDSELLVTKLWNNELEERLSNSLTVLKNDNQIKENFILKVKNIEDELNDEILEINSKIKELEEKLNKEKKKECFSEIEKSIKVINIENSERNINIFKDEIDYKLKLLVNEKNKLEENKKLLLHSKELKLKDLEFKIKELKEKNNLTIVNIEKKFEELIANDSKNRQIHDNNGNKIKNLNKEIDDENYKVRNMKNELKYKRKLELNMKTKIKQKEIYITNNYKQVFNNYWKIIKQKYKIILDCKNELEFIENEVINLNNNLNDSLNTRINIINNFISSIDE